MGAVVIRVTGALSLGMKKEPWASGPYWPQGLMGANVCWVTGDWFEFGDSKMENRKRSCADYREMCEALFGRS